MILVFAQQQHEWRPLKIGPRPSFKFHSSENSTNIELLFTNLRRVFTNKTKSFALNVQSQNLFIRYHDLSVQMSAGHLCADGFATTAHSELKHCMYNSSSSTFACSHLIDRIAYISSWKLCVILFDGKNVKY